MKLLTPILALFLAAAVIGIMPTACVPGKTAQAATQMTGGADTNGDGCIASDEGTTYLRKNFAEQYAVDILNVDIKMHAMDDLEKATFLATRLGAPANIIDEMVTLEFRTVTVSDHKYGNVHLAVVNASGCAILAGWFPWQVLQHIGAEYDALKQPSSYVAPYDGA